MSDRETEASWHARRERELAEATPESVRAIVVAHLDAWKWNGDPFSWPDDGLSRYGWQYGIHCWCVGDWNATNRAEPYEVFLRAWVQNDAKVWNALRDPGGWFKVRED